MSELHHECGVAAIYHFPDVPESPMCPDQGASEVSRLLPRMLQDIQNRGQLAAGMTTYSPGRANLLDTIKDIGTVAEVFRLSHRGKSESLMKEYAGQAAIGHVRYATCGKDDRNYAQPFEREHIHKYKWFSFCFNGQLANYNELRDKLLDEGEYHLARETDTEIIMHELGRELSNSTPEDRSIVEIFTKVVAEFDGAYSLAFLNARAELLLARDPLGMKPLCYAHEGSLFAAASESVALLNLGFSPESIKSLKPGHLIFVDPSGVQIKQFAKSEKTAHCFFEWIYFANVASTLDDKSVYMSRTRLGEELAKQELEAGTVEIDEDTIVVPVPDTSKAAADAMAFKLCIPSREGLIRNRYSGRTFIEGGRARYAKAASKYTPLHQVLKDKKVFLVEDSIVRSTTMRVLLDRIRDLGQAREIHVRVACPPIIAPCFYGIDMSTIRELFAPKFMNDSLILDDEMQDAMAKELGCDSLKYLPVGSISRAIQLPEDRLCQACITSAYPTPYGQQLYEIDLGKYQKAKHANQEMRLDPNSDDVATRTYEEAIESTVRS